MPSPFPGMDPFLEPHWADVHHRLVGHAAEWLNTKLPDDLAATTDERVIVQSNGDRIGNLGPDVKVFSPNVNTRLPKSAAIVIDAPYQIVTHSDPIKQGYVKVVDLSGELITVIEFLSPANKRNPDMKQYRKKRASLLDDGVNLVEIDLVRGGNWQSLLRPGFCPEAALSEYRAIVRTAAPNRAAYLFPIRLREPIPDIPIPLRTSEETTKLPVQQLLTRVYDTGRYGARLTYRRDFNRPFNPDDAGWIQSIIESQQSQK